MQDNCELNKQNESLPKSENKQAKRPHQKKKMRGIIALVLACVLLIGGTMAYFTDYATLQTSGTAGTVEISVEDNINLLNANGQDILNPGDMRDVNFTVVNDGNKSVDTSVIITLTSSEPMSNRVGLYEGGHIHYPTINELDVYFSEYELYWASDVELVEGYGYYPKENVRPLQARSINAAGTQIKYILDEDVLSGNSSLDEQEVEYVSKDKTRYEYIFLDNSDIWDYDISYYEDTDEYYADIIINEYTLVDRYDIDQTGAYVYVVPDTYAFYDEEAEANQSFAIKQVTVWAYEDYDFMKYAIKSDSIFTYEATEQPAIITNLYDDYNTFKSQAESGALNKISISTAEYEALPDEIKAKYELASDSKTYDIVLLFDPHSSNRFQNSSVSINVEIKAKQHRNTEAGWELVEEITAASINSNTFTVERNAFGLVELTGVKPGVDLSNKTSITIPEGVEVISDKFFSEYYKLRTVNLPSTIKEIKSRAFYWCENLTTINFPDGLEVIGNNAFDGCTSLSNISLPDTLKHIGSGAFLGTSLTSITLPGSLEYLGAYAFEECGSLETIVISNGVKEIVDYVFANCRGIKTIVIPDSVTTIGDSAFANYYLYTIVVDVYTNNPSALNFDWKGCNMEANFLPYENYTNDLN